MQIPDGLTAAEFAIYRRVFHDTHEKRISFRVLNLDDDVLGELRPEFLDGEIQYDDTDTSGESVTRVLHASFADPDRVVYFEPDQPTDAPAYRRRQIQVIYSVWVPQLDNGAGVEPGRWVDAKPFTGPVWDYDRDGAQVTITCHGKERLALGNPTRGRTFKKKTPKTRIITEMLLDAGEGRGMMTVPSAPAKNPKELVVARDDQPWKVARHVARSMSKQLFYNGAGRVILRRQPNRVAYNVPLAAALSAPRFDRGDLADAKNLVQVLGRKPKGEKKRVRSRVKAVKGSLSAQSLRRRGKPHKLWHIEENDQFTQPECNQRADEIRDGYEARTTQSSVDIVPVPFLDERDIVRVETVDGVVKIRMRQATLPLSTDGNPVMIVGALTKSRRPSGKGKDKNRRNALATAAENAGPRTLFGGAAVEEQGHVSVVTLETDGDELTDTTLVGALQLPVAYAGDFYDGCTVLVGADVLTVDTVEDVDGAAGILHLTAATPSPYDIGTPVEVYNPTRGQLDVDYIAEVVLDDADEDGDDDPKPARIPHNLIDHVRDTIGDQDLSVTIVRDGSGYRVTDVIGREPVVDGNYSPQVVLAGAEAHSAEMRTTGQKAADILTSLLGARVHFDTDSQGRGRGRWFADDNTVIGTIRGIVDEATQRYIFGISGGDQSNPARTRLWTYLAGNSIRRRIDLIADEVQINGLIQATNGLTLQLSPTIQKGEDGNSNVTRVLSNTGTTTVPHLVAGGGVPHVNLRGGNSKNFDIDVAQVTGSELTFAVTWRRAGDGHQGGDPAVNETVTFDWSIRAYDRPSPVV